MNADEYLDRLNEQLKDFPADEREDLLEEIASHIESGERDPQREEDGDYARWLKTEMGSPEQMGRGLRNLYRPNRLVDLLWVLVPYFIVNGLVSLVFNIFWHTSDPGVNPASPYFYLSGRIHLALALIYLLAGWRRRSIVLILFWMVEVINTLLMLIIRENRWVPGREAVPGTALESFVLLAALLGFLLWTARLLREHQFDPLLIIFVLLPLVDSIANLGTSLLVRPLDVYQVESLALIQSVIIRLGWTAGIAGFFLLEARESRWFSLLLVAVCMAVPNLVLYHTFPGAVVMWVGLLCVVFLGWALDRHHHHSDHRLPG
jgi:hypothetical protein